IEPKSVEDKTKHPKDVDALFLEVDGLHVHQQNSSRSTREVKLGVVHEGWKRKRPSSEEYEQRNKSNWYSREEGENVRELFSRYVYSQYSITEDTPVNINGDAAPCIRAGVASFGYAVFTYVRYRLYKWFMDTLMNLSKQVRR